MNLHFRIGDRFELQCTPTVSLSGSVTGINEDSSVNFRLSTGEERTIRCFEDELPFAAWAQLQISRHPTTMEAGEAQIGQVVLRSPTGKLFQGSTTEAYGKGRIRRIKRNQAIELVTPAGMVKVKNKPKHYGQQTLITIENPQATDQLTTHKVYLGRIQPIPGQAELPSRITTEETIQLVRDEFYFFPRITMNCLSQPHAIKQYWQAKENLDLTFLQNQELFARFLPTLSVVFAGIHLYQEHEGLGGLSQTRC